MKIIERLSEKMKSATTLTDVIVIFCLYFILCVVWFAIIILGLWLVS